MRLFALSALLLALPWVPVTPVSAAEPPDPARDVVLAARLDEYFSNIANDSALDARQRGSLTPEQAECVAHFSPADFTADLAAALRKLLSAEELAAGLEFYRSPAGERLVQLTFQVLDDHRRGKRAAPALKFSASEQATIEAFAATTAGGKLLDQGALADSKPVEAVLKDKIFGAMARCMKPS